MSVAEKEPEYGMRSPRKIMNSDLKRADISRPDYRVVLKDNNITPEDVIRPEFFANVADTFTKDAWPFPMVEVIWSDGSKYMRLMVISATRLTAKVRVVQFIDFEDEAQEAFEYQDVDFKDPSMYKIEFKGSIDKHVVIRLSDNEKLVTGISLKTEAREWLDKYISNL